MNWNRQCPRATLKNGEALTFAMRNQAVKKKANLKSNFSRKQNGELDKHIQRVSMRLMSHVALFYETDIGESIRSQGFVASEPRGDEPTIENRWRTSSPCPRLDNLSVDLSGSRLTKTKLFFGTIILNESLVNTVIRRFNKKSILSRAWKQIGYSWRFAPVIMLITTSHAEFAVGLSIPSVFLQIFKDIQITILVSAVEAISFQHSNNALNLPCIHADN